MEVRPFLEAHAALILRLAKTTVGPHEPASADDVANEVVVSLLRAASKGTFSPDRVENAEAYLRIVVRHAAHRARTRSRSYGEVAREGDVAEIEREAPSSGRLPDPETLTRRAHDARKTLEAIKAKLRPRDAVAFALLVEEGLDIDEVARALGTTTNNVYQMRHRILAVARAMHADDKNAASAGVLHGEEGAQ